MAKLVVVIGATGVQGGSVVSALLKNPEYKIRAVTRNASSDAAKKLSAEGVEVVTADSNDVESLKVAFKGANAAFAVTNFWETFVTKGAAAGQQADVDHGKNLADAAAVTPTLSHYIWSTINSSKILTEGKIEVPHFEGKAEVDEYIKKTHPALAAKTTFLWVGYYGLNNIQLPMFKPALYSTAGKYLCLMPCTPETPVPTIGLTSTNVGLFVQAILAQPHLTQPARYVEGITDIIPNGKLMELIAELSGKQIEYVTTNWEEYQKLWPYGWGLEVAQQMGTWEIAKENCWKLPGHDSLSKEDLKIEGLVGIREALSAVDWTTVF